MQGRTAVTVATLFGFVLGVAFSFSWSGPGGGGPSSVQARPAPASSSPEPVLPVHEARGTTPERRTAVVRAVARAKPAVVSIQTEIPTQSPFFFYNLPNRTSEGSGVVIRPDGVVLTNAHVVDGATAISASLSDGSTYPATVIGLDENLDLAVLQLEDATDLPTVPLGSSSDLMLGEPTIAIGNPFGLHFTVTTGVVSSTAQNLEVRDRVFQDYIQTDAGINPGNSGGPLLNIHGELIGINTAIRRDAENIGFAIPVDRAAKVARDLLRYGSVRAPWLGVTVVDVGGPRYRGTPLEEGAVMVHSVESPQARSAGLRQGDILLEVDARPIHSRDDLNLHLASRDPGVEVQVEGIRDEQPFSCTLTADRIPEQMASSLLEERLGIEVEPLDTERARTYGLRTRQGLLVTEVRPRGAFAQAGLRAGDALVAIHGRALTQVEDLRVALVRALSSHRSTVLLTVQRGPYQGHVEIEI